MMPGEMSLGQFYLSLPFPQDNVLTINEFLEALKTRGEPITRELLESWDREGLLNPLFFMTRDKLEGGTGSMKYGTVFSFPTYYKDRMQEGKLSFPSDGTYRPWKEYLDEDGEEETWIVYHRVQMFRAVQIRRSISWLTTLELLPENNSEFHTYIENVKRRYASTIQGLLDASDTADKQCKSMLVFGDLYLPRIRRSLFCSDLKKQRFLEDWFEWSKGFDVGSEVKRLGLDVDTLKRWYTRFSLDGDTHDPLREWFLLVRHIRPAKRQQLRGQALLAQDHYDAAYILKFLLEDLHVTDVCEPDEVMDSRKGSWKTRRYGGPVDYKSRFVLENMLADYGISTRYGVFLLCEGPTEEVAIPIIGRAMGIDFEERGIHFECLKGSGFNKTAWRLRLEQIQGEDGIPFVILDNENDAEEYMDMFNKIGLVDKENCVLWEEEFESGNWSEEEILEQFNLLAAENDIDLKLGTDDIARYSTKSERGKQAKITKLLERAAYDLRPDYSYSKVDLGRKLAENTANRIRTDIERGEYKPKTEIEMVLIKVKQLAQSPVRRSILPTITRHQVNS